jgi:hypothetical protein
MAPRHHKHDNQPPNEFEGESNKFVLSAAEERATNTQQSAEREGLMWWHNYVVMFVICIRIKLNES